MKEIFRSGLFPANVAEDMADGGGGGDRDSRNPSALGAWVLGLAAGGLLYNFWKMVNVCIYKAH